ncbi:MAG: hypothetical protein Q8R37_03810 [Nanoarchaeota archaeon]|nr:hypothetical protein [Nanoarchaeota archaeon]
MTKTIEILEHSVLRGVHKVISSLEQKPQINTAGIIEELEYIVKPNNVDPLNGIIELPPVYHDVRNYYDQAKTALEKGETFHNQINAMQFLNGIKQKYS